MPLPMLALIACFAVAFAVCLVQAARVWWRTRQDLRLDRDYAVWSQAFAEKGGIKRDTGKYDQTKAVAGWRRSQRHTPHGTPLRGPSRRRETPRRRESSRGIALVSTDSRRRAGGGK